MYLCMYVCMCICYIYICIYIFKEKTKPIFTENISATAFINNSLLSTSHFSLLLHFKTNLQVIIYIIYIKEPDRSDH